MNTKGKIKKFFVGALAGVTMLGGMMFVGCSKEPDKEHELPNELPIIEVEKNHASSEAELQTNFIEQTDEFVGRQLDKLLDDLGIEENISAEYVLKCEENGIKSIKFTFEYEHHTYTAYSTFAEPISFDVIANYNEDDEMTNSANDFIESAQTTHEKEYILNHVSSLEELEEVYPEKISQFLNTQFAYAFEKQGLTEGEDNKVKERTQNIVADESGIQQIEYKFTFSGREQFITVTYQSPISLDWLANYPEHEESKEQVVDAMVDSEMVHEIPLSSYSDQEIISLFQDQINANLFVAVEDSVKVYLDAISEPYNINNITSYQWRLGDIVDGKVQNLQVFWTYNTGTAECRYLYNIFLKNPTPLAELAKENNPIEYSRGSSLKKENGYNYALESQTKYGEWADIVAPQLAQDDPDFDYVNSQYAVRVGSVSNAFEFHIYFFDGNEVRDIGIGVTGNASANSEVLLASIKKNLEDGKFEYHTWERTSFSLVGTPLEWTSPAKQNENIK